MSSPPDSRPASPPAEGRVASPSSGGEIVDVASPPWSGRPWPLVPGTPLGQAFRAHLPGLCAVEVLLTAAPGATGELRWRLHGDGPAGPLLHRQTTPVSALADGRYARFSLPTLADSAGRRYVCWLEATAPGLAVYADPTLAAGDGEVYRGQAPADGSLALQTFAVAGLAGDEVGRQLAALADERAALSVELTAARAELRRLRDERSALQARLAALLERLGAGGGDAG